MTRKQVLVKCPYCEKVCAVAGLTSHVRSKHTDKYEEFKENKTTFIEENKVGAEQPASPVEPTTPAPTPETPEPEPVKVDKPDTPAPEEQQTAGFLGFIRQCLETV